MVLEEIDLRNLKNGTPGITPEFGSCLAQAAAVCLEEQGHSTGAIMKVDGEFKTSFAVLWESTTEQIRRCWGDIEVTTENGAYGFAILLVLRLTEHTIIQRSRKGTGFDFWLGDPDSPEPLFQGKSRLEVSGIREGDHNTIRNRIRGKINQVGKFNSTLPAIIIVVEFSEPRSRIENK
jgi:hypothetical protein